MTQITISPVIALQALADTLEKRANERDTIHPKTLTAASGYRRGIVEGIRMSVRLAREVAEQLDEERRQASADFTITMPAGPTIKEK